MIRVTLRSLLARKLRLLLSTLAIVVGVASVSGSLVLADTLRAAFLDLFSSISEGVSVNVRGVSSVDALEAPGPPVPESVLTQVRQVDGVAEAYGATTGYAAVVGKDGKVVSGGGAPTLGVDWTPSETMNPLSIVTGRPPESSDEVAVDRLTAEDGELVVGEDVRVLLRSGVSSFQLVGTVEFGSSGNLAGATLTVFDPATAQQLVGTPGAYESVSAAAEPGVSDEELATRVSAVLPAGYEAITREQLAEEGAESISQALGFFTTFLLVFAGIALFVGAFLINNTFTILIGQRTQELALMRTLGARRAQVIRAVLLEAVLVGALAALIGFAVGIGFAYLIELAFGALGIELPSIGLKVRPPTLLWSLAVGVIVTAVATLGPARRAANIAPIEALRLAQAPPRPAWGRRTLAGLVVATVGIALMVFGLGGGPLILTGLGAVVAFLGLAVLSPLLVRPLGTVVGTPLAWLSVAGRLGRDNTMRNPARTATTAAALMIGLAFVTAAGTFGSSARASVTESLEESLGADYVIVQSGFGLGFSPALAEAVAQQPGVAYASSIRGVQGVVEGPAEGSSDLPDEEVPDPAGTPLAGVDPGTITTAAGLTVTEGTLDDLRGETVAIEEGEADKWGVSLGDSVVLSFGTAERVALPIVAVFEANDLITTPNGPAPFVLALPTFDRLAPTALDSVVFVGIAEDADPAAVGASLDEVAAAYPDVEVQDRTQLIESQEDQINLFINMLYLLLAVAVLVALLGIVNTLALSVLERTSEIGVLRAIGMRRGQVSSMIVVESVIIAIFGALLGLAAGTGIGYVLIRSLADEGLTSFAVPWGSLLVFLLFAVALGILAALLPAWRASRVRIVDAIATE